MKSSATRKTKNRHSMVEPVAKARVKVRSRITMMGQRTLIYFSKPGKEGKLFLTCPGCLTVREGAGHGGTSQYLGDKGAAVLTL